MKTLLLTLISVVIIFSGDAFAFEFSNKECDFKVNFPFRPSVKKVVHPLGNGIYSNTYMVSAEDKNTGRSFSAQCDTSFRLVQSTITTSQKQQTAEWSIGEWSKMVGLNDTNMWWEEQGKNMTLRMVGRRVIVVGGAEFKLALQARMYLGQKSTMMVTVAELAKLSPSKEMEVFLNTSVQPR